MTTFAGQIAVVTGASSGIGCAIALALAAQGFQVCLVGRKLTRLQEVAAQVPETVARVRCYCANLTEDKHVRELAARLGEDWEGLDVLVHGAGVISLGAIEQVSVDEFDWQYRTNVRGPFAFTQGSLPLLRCRQGQIVFINSSVGLNARATVGPYATTKHALKAIADSLREEVNPFGVRVLSVFLGRTASEMQKAVHDREGRPTRRNA